MDEAAIARLLELNRQFYGDFAESFGRSRAAPALGFAALLDYLPQPCPRFLDVGCGEGRLGRFLLERQAIAAYAGVDFSPALLAQAAVGAPGEYWQRDLSRPDCLDGLGQYTAAACLATLQHIPGRSRRLALVRSLAARLEPSGRLFISTWQFLDSARQRRKILPWGDVGLRDDQVDAGDYLLAWRRGGFGRRYVRFIDLAELTALANEAGLALIDHFRADGREGNLNLYAVLTRAGRPGQPDRIALGSPSCYNT